MSAHERAFVLTIEPMQAEQLKVMASVRFDGPAVVDRFDTQVLRATDSPARGRLTLVVTTDWGRSRWRVVGLAIAESAGRGSTFHRRLRVRALRLVDGDRLNETTLQLELDQATHVALAEAVTRRAAELTEARSLPIREAVRRLTPGVLEAVLADLSPLRPDSASVDRWQQEADAVRLVLRAAVLDAELPEWQPPDSDAPFLAGLVGAPHEATLIDHDIRILPGWRELVGTAARPDIHVFRNEHRRIEVLNANATTAEAHLGVDLVYHLAPVNGFVMVQYKKLVGDTTPVDDRFLQQLARMRRIDALGATPQKSADYRLGSRTSCFVKLAHSREFDPTADRMMKGMYLPLEFVDLLLTDGSATGARGGASLGYGNVDRHLTNTQFTQLLGAGWIGTTGVTLQQLRDIAQQTLADGRSLVLAADSGELRPGRRRLTGRRRTPVDDVNFDQDL
jgi:hypothetical protein